MWIYGALGTQITECDWWCGFALRTKQWVNFGTSAFRIFRITWVLSGFQIYGGFMSLVSSYPLVYQQWAILFWSWGRWPNGVWWQTMPVPLNWPFVHCRLKSDIPNPWRSIPDFLQFLRWRVPVQTHSVLRFLSTASKGPPQDWMRHPSLLLMKQSVQQN